MADSIDSRALASSDNDYTVEQALEAQEEYVRRGYGFKEWGWVARKHPAFEMRRLEYSQWVFAHEGMVLPVKYRELIEIVLLSFMGIRNIKAHARRALRAGATMQEIIEALEVGTIPAGMALMHFAIPFLMEVDDEESAKQEASPKQDS